MALFAFVVCCFSCSGVCGAKGREKTQNTKQRAEAGRRERRKRESARRWSALGKRHQEKGHKGRGEQAFPFFQRSCFAPCWCAWQEPASSGFWTSLIFKQAKPSPCLVQTQRCTLPLIPASWAIRGKRISRLQPALERPVSTCLMVLRESKSLLRWLIRFISRMMETAREQRRLILMVWALTIIRLTEAMRCPSTSREHQVSMSL